MTLAQFRELFDVLRAHPGYDVRPVIQCSRAGSAIVSSIELRADAESTMSEFRYDVMFKNPPFEELTEEQMELLANHAFAVDSRPELRDWLRRQRRVA